MPRRFLTILALAFLAPPAVSAQTPALTGVWKSDGYGLVFVADGDTLQAYEVTRTTCVPSMKMIRRPATPAGVEAVYTVDNELTLVKATPDPDEKRLHNDGAASDMMIHRMAARPAVCDKPTPDTPEGNFEVFAQTWAEHYILFDEKHADWPAVVAAARANVKATTTPADLFEILQGMIAPFEDAHTSIGAEAIQRRYRTLRKGTDRLIKNGMKDFRTKDLPPLLAVTDARLQGPIRKWCDDQVQFGRLDESTGYLRFLSEGGYTKEGDFASGLDALEEALDAIFTDSKLKGLVIDVRINFGGADPYGLALASRLATSDYVAYSKEARMDPVDHKKWTPGQPSLVRPSTRPSFRGPVVELTGPLTISAGETMTQALMGRTPRVIRIGENTQGVFSDVLGRTLPNGWTFGLPNEVFRSPEGKTFDGPGIPPDMAVPVFADEDLKAGRDPALERARAELYRNQ
ncbi:MAG: S41 family peptidase [Acidobacteria bacterium]|nr:S41 family peptidase [Acidobacteriota bacterium]